MQLFQIGYPATAGAVISSLFQTSWAGEIVQSSTFFFLTLKKTHIFLNV